MKRIIYKGLHDAVEVAGKLAKRGEAVEVDDTTADNLLKRADWAPAADESKPKQPKGKAF